MSTVITELTESVQPIFRVTYKQARIDIAKSVDNTKGVAKFYKMKEGVKGHDFLDQSLNNFDEITMEDYLLDDSTKTVCRFTPFDKVK